MIKKGGFILVESLITSLLLMLVWYTVVLCAVQAIIIERDIEQKMEALLLARTSLEKLRAGVYPLQEKIMHENGFQIVIEEVHQAFHHMLFYVTLKIMRDSGELLCVKTAILKNADSFVA